MRLIRKLLLGFLVLFALLAWAANIGSQTISPSTKFNFTPMVDGPKFRIDVDESTRHRTIDEDGDTLVGAVVRVTPTYPIESGKPVKTVGTIIYSVIAVCGHNGMVVVQSNLFDPAGKEIEVVTEMEVTRLGNPSMPTSIVYNNLCKGYTSKDGNKLTWV